MNDLNSTLLYLTGIVAFLAVATVVLHVIVEARNQRPSRRERRQRRPRRPRWTGRGLT